MSEQQNTDSDLPEYPVYDPSAGTGSDDRPGGVTPPAGPGGLDRAQRANRYAVGSLVCGILSLPMMLLAAVGLPVGIAAVVLGVIGLRQVKESAGRESGTGLAITGIVLGGLGTLIGVVGLVLGAVLLARM